MSKRTQTFSIETEDGPGVQVVAVKGEADMTSVPHLEAAIREASERASLVLVDLAEATFIDSSTIAVLVNWTGDIQHAGGRLTVVCPENQLLRIFRQVGLDEVLNIVDSRPPAAI